MQDMFSQVSKQSLPDALAQRIRASIQSGEYRVGERLPSISEMARSFRVGLPTLREALRMLESAGLVEIRHGSGVYVGKNTEALVFANPRSLQGVTAKLICDVIEARIPLELRAVALAAEQATDTQLQQMVDLLSSHEGRSANTAFHHLIALASGNAVLAQMLTALRELLPEADGLNDCSCHEHRAILEALQRRLPELAAERMRAHLNGLRDAFYGCFVAEEPVRAAS